jgi:hypothetical protein
LQKEAPTTPRSGWWREDVTCGTDGDSDDSHRDLTILTVGQLIELGIPRPEWLRKPNLGPKAVDAIFYVFDQVVRPDAVAWLGA